MASNNSFNGTEKGLGKSCRRSSNSSSSFFDGRQDGKFLLALDFDNTLISHCSKPKGMFTCIQPLFPGGILPENLEDIRRNVGWDAFVRATFDELHAQGIRDKDAILNCLRNVEWIEGMKELLEAAKKELNAKIIVVSDSHTLHIEQALDLADLSRYVDRIFAKKSEFDAENGRVVFTSPPGDKDAGSSRCSGNVGCRTCKGDILESFFDDYSEVAFVGDGLNDLCAVKRLRKNQDLGFSRMGFRLSLALKEESNRDLQVDVHEWKNGHDVLEVLRKRA